MGWGAYKDFLLLLVGRLVVEGRHGGGWGGEGRGLGGEMEECILKSRGRRRIQRRCDVCAFRARVYHVGRIDRALPHNT